MWAQCEFPTFFLGGVICGISLCVKVVGGHYKEWRASLSIRRSRSPRRHLPPVVALRAKKHRPLIPLDPLTLMNVIFSPIIPSHVPPPPTRHLLSHPLSNHPPPVTDNGDDDLNTKLGDTGPATHVHIPPIHDRLEILDATCLRLARSSTPRTRTLESHIFDNHAGHSHRDPKPNPTSSYDPTSTISHPGGPVLETRTFFPPILDIVATTVDNVQIPLPTSLILPPFLWEIEMECQLQPRRLE